MSEENVKIMELIYESWLSDPALVFDEAVMETVLDPEFELHPDPDAYWVGVDATYRGLRSLGAYMEAIYDAFDDYTPQIERFIDAGDKVVTLAIERGRGKDSGAEVQQNHTAHVWTLRDGKPVRLDLYLDRERALRAVGLSD